MKQFWLLSFKNLRRNLKRNLATGSAIAFGFCGILLLQAYAYRVSNFLRAHTVYGVHTGHLVIFAEDGFDKFRYKPRQYSLTPEDQAFVAGVLRAEPEVENFEKQINGQGLVGNGCVSLPFIAQGYEPAVDLALRNHPQVKEWLPGQKSIKTGQGLAESNSGDGVLLSVGLSRALGKTTVKSELPAGAKVTMVDCNAPNVAEQLKRDSNVQLLSGTWRGNVSAVDGDVIGTYATGFQEADNAAVIADVNLLQKLFDTQNAGRMAVWIKDLEKVKQVAASLKSKFAAAGKKYEIVFWDEERLSPFYFGTVQFLDTMVTFVGFILAAVITLSVLNSTTMTIMERSQEIGMYRAMGFRRLHIRVLYLQEALWLSLLSLFSGSLLGGVIILIVNGAHILYRPPGISGGMILRLVLNPRSSIISAVLILVLVLIATFVAVSSRLRQKPADLLGGALR
jgi:putative ABC transport system permease protein